MTVSTRTNNPLERSRHPARYRSALSRLLFVLLEAMVVPALYGCSLSEEAGKRPGTSAQMRAVDPAPSGTPVIVKLPEPNKQGTVSIEESLARRRSVRAYSPGPLSINEVAQLLWAAQGVTDPAGFRTAPSAGATYPLETYLLCRRVTGIEEGVYRYSPDEHIILKVRDDNQIASLAAAAGQEWIQEAPAILVFSGVYERTASRYGDRAERYVHMEAGHAAQNVYLQAVALGLGTVTIGAFADDKVREILGLGAGEQPLYIMPVGRLPE